MEKRENREDADRKADGQKKGGERRGPVGGSALWYMIAIGVGMLLLTMWFNMDSGTKLEYNQFVELLKKMGGEKDLAKRPEVKIKVTHKAGTTEREYYYWNPTEVVVGEDEVLGKIKRQPVDPQPNEKVKTEPFAVSIRGVSQGAGTAELFKLL